MLEIDDQIRDALNNDHLEKEDLRKMVYTSNVITLLQDGLEKILEGKTSFEEIYRIIEIDSDSNEDYAMEIAEANKERKQIQKAEETKEQTNTEVVTNANSIISKSSPVQENTEDMTATVQTAPNQIESIMNQRQDETKERKEDIIIMPPTVPVFPEPTTAYNTSLDNPKSTETNATTQMTSEQNLDNTPQLIEQNLSIPTLIPENNISTNSSIPTVTLPILNEQKTSN